MEKYIGYMSWYRIKCQDILQIRFTLLSINLTVLHRRVFSTFSRSFLIIFDDFQGLFSSSCYQLDDAMVAAILPLCLLVTFILLVQQDHVTTVPPPADKNLTTLKRNQLRFAVAIAGLLWGFELQTFTYKVSMNQNFL